MNPRKEERNRQMLADRRAGMMIKEIAKKYGLCYSRAFYILRNQERIEKEGR